MTLAAPHLMRTLQHVSVGGFDGLAIFIDGDPVGAPRLWSAREGLTKSSRRQRSDNWRRICARFFGSAIWGASGGLLAGSV